MFTGHGLGGSGGAAPSISPFNPSWRDSVAITLIGGGMYMAIPVAWHLVRHKGSFDADAYLGTMAVVLLGAIAWGALLGEFNTFYVFFGGIAVFGTPLAAAAVARVLERLQRTRRHKLAVLLIALCVVQLSYGVAIAGIPKLQISGPLPNTEPIPVSLLSAIRQLPSDARLAYACRPPGEATFAQPQLVSIDVHTGRRVVPMCFQADVASSLIGGEWSPQVPNASFQWAPQREIYPEAAARPSSATVAAFLKDHGIHYIYADAKHPNSLVGDAEPIAASGDFEVLRVP
jgi:hypothetical protein